MLRKLNRFGEIEFSKNEALFTMPLIKLGTEEIEVLEENYRLQVKALTHTNSFIYANHISSIRDRVQLAYDLEGCMDFPHLHRFEFNEVLYYMETMVDIANEHVNVLWERNNFVVDLTEKKVKALLFEFDGFVVYKKDSSFEGLKELILLALTKHHAILGKPKRNDFIIKEEEVFQFAEDILKTTTIEEIQRVITSTIKENEYRESQLEDAKKKKQEDSKLNQLTGRFKRTPVFKTPEQKLKEGLNNDFDRTAESKAPKKSLIDKMTTPKGMLATMGILAIAGLLYFLVDIEGGSAKANQLEEAEEEMKVKEKITEAYRLYLSEDEDNQEVAYATLDSVGYENLPKKDKAILIDWYLEQSKFTKAIATDRNSSYAVGDYLVSQENGLEALEELAGSIEENEVLAFDIASMQDQYQLMIENSDIRFNERRARKVVEAFVLTNQAESLETLIDAKKEDETSYNNLMNFSDKYLASYTQMRELADEKKAKDEELAETKSKYDAEKDKKKKEALKKTVDNLAKESAQLKEREEEIVQSIKGN
ncbi:hypothetical protein ACQKDB_15850 [Planococcus kocurii]|uniref:hypothetical protein n=1 Tax=Planococcus kocurii TaxID=1374 RepID=UPI003D089E63